jgi:hypothetical protein
MRHLLPGTPPLFIAAQPMALLVTAMLAGCAAAPPSASLTDIHDRAARELFESCIKTGFTINRHVPLRDLVNGCDGMVNERIGQVAARRK